MSAPRIVFYAVNGLGLGHVTRLIAIARAVRRLAPATQILFLTSSEADGVIYREGFAAIKLPSKTIRDECGITRRAYLKLVHTVTWNAISAFDPDVLVVDTYPAGSVEELLPVLRWRQKNVFVYREQRAESFQRDLLQSVLPLYDLVIVPHRDLGSVMPLPEPEKARAVGPIMIREREELLSRRAARAQLGLPEDGTLVYASFGGGGDPEAEHALSLTANAVRASGAARLVVGSGPLLRGRVEERAALADAHVIRGRYPMLDVLPAFDAAVSAAGYNSVHELLFAGVPAVLVPFGRVLDDQDRRAREYEALGACLRCAPLTATNLASALRRVASPELRRSLGRRASETVGANGAGAAGRAVLELAA